jgi:hypothetical protein
VVVVGILVLAVLAVVLAAALGAAVRAQRKGVTRVGPRAIDPFTVGEPWRHLVRSALRSQARYDALVAGARPGPARDRLTGIGDRVDEAVQECWRIAQRGNELRRTLSGIDVGASRAQLATLDTADASSPDRRASLQSRIETYERIAATTAGTEQQLRLLVARLEETAARGAELSLITGDEPALAALGSEVSGVVDELEALRLAFEETNGGPPAPPSLPS